MTQPLAKQSEGDPIAAILDLPGPVPTVLAVGAFLKNTLCLAKDCAAIISHDVGNLESVAAVRDFQAHAERLLMLAGGLPVVVAHDLHPDFHSTRWAEAFCATTGVEAVPVQHHHCARGRSDG